MVPAAGIQQHMLLVLLALCCLLTATAAARTAQAPNSPSALKAVPIDDQQDTETPLAASTRYPGYSKHGRDPKRSADEPGLHKPPSKNPSTNYPHYPKHTPYPKHQKYPVPHGYPPHSTCRGCPAGSECTPCPLGTYSAGNASDTTLSKTPCTPCAEGFTTPWPGATSEAECVVLRRMQDDPKTLAQKPHTPADRLPNLQNLTLHRLHQALAEQGLEPHLKSHPTPNQQPHSMDKPVTGKASYQGQPDLSDSYGDDTAHPDTYYPHNDASDWQYTERHSPQRHQEPYYKYRDGEYDRPHSLFDNTYQSDNPDTPYADDEQSRYKPSYGSGSDAEGPHEYDSYGQHRDYRQRPHHRDQYWTHKPHNHHVHPYPHTPRCGCPAGSRCVLCPRGTYSAGNAADNGLNSTSCVPCPEGKTTRSRGARSIVECSLRIECPPFDGTAAVLPPDFKDETIEANLASNTVGPPFLSGDGEISPVTCFAGSKGAVFILEPAVGRYRGIEATTCGVGGNLDTVINVFPLDGDGCTNSTKPLNCNDDFGCAVRSRVNFTALPGQQYAVVLTPFGNTPPNIDMIQIRASEPRCPRGSFFPDPSLPLIQDCQPCAAGSWGPGGGVVDATGCTNCTDGLDSYPGAGSPDECFVPQCRPGYFFLNPSRPTIASCRPCPAGSWGPGGPVENATCTNCTGFLISKPGAGAPGECFEPQCPRGSFFPDPSQPTVASCTSCSAGTWGPGGTNVTATCTNCTTGLTSNPGAGSPEECVAAECLPVAERVAIVPGTVKNSMYEVALGNLTGVPSLGCDGEAATDGLGGVFVLEPAPIKRSMAASTCGLMSSDTILNVIPGNCSTLGNSSLTCNDNACGGAQSFVSFVAAEKAAYSLVVTSRSGSKGDVTKVRIQDVCATLAQENITAIPANVTNATYTGTLDNSATLLFESCSGKGPRALFRVEPASQDRNITISTCDQGFYQLETIMSVFSTGESGCLDKFEICQELGRGCSAFNEGQTLRWQAAANQAYLIMLNTYDGVGLQLGLGYSMHFLVN